MSWQGIDPDVRVEMEAMHQKREMALAGSRQIIQTSSKCIRHVHRNQFDVAEQLLAEAKQKSWDLRTALAESPVILYAGYLQDAEKEMVEAAATMAIVREQPIPLRAELKVDATSYLHGLGEAASECRRYVLDEMRNGSLVNAERMLGLMEDIYESLITFDYPDGMTGGLRRTCDALRAVLERTRSDLTLTAIQRQLMQDLRSAQGKG